MEQSGYRQNILKQFIHARYQVQCYPDTENPVARQLKVLPDDRCVQNSLPVDEALHQKIKTTNDNG